MPKYRVFFQATTEGYDIFEAESEEEAMRLAEEISFQYLHGVEVVGEHEPQYAELAE